MKKNNKGFTLVEILAVIVVLGLIMIVALPTYGSVYNSIKLTTYLNTINTIRNAALDYGGNSDIKDSVKYMHDGDGKEWCKIVSIDNLIKSGYLKSDDDVDNQITDIFTGLPMGYNYQSLKNTNVPLNSVALCYCKDNLDIDAILVKDIAPDQVYHAGENVRNYINDSSNNSSANDYEFRTLKVSFVYNDALKRIIKARRSDGVTIEGVYIRFGNLFDDVGNDYSTSNEAFIKKVNTLFYQFLTYEKPTCER